MIAERIGWECGMTIPKERVHRVRPAYLSVDPLSRTVCQPAELAQRDLWFPPVDIPLGYGQSGRSPLLDRGIDPAHLRGITRRQLAHLGTLDFLKAKENAIFLGPPARAGRASRPGWRPGLPGRPPGRVRARRPLSAAHHAGRLRDELVKLDRYPLIVIDEVGYIPFEAEATYLFSS
ncbi:hypothetical protein [Kitasatospora purpeofusca]|uniref:hypothetical protein n=1 Tax=Kitasatospora purpeofusca TaxID=67352 RepID=UPI002A5AE259|nr:hypothetical protein [Kitasatospora purpeofusca]MDY0810712.1 hypothetical protein [Kitasatospora purpeofusca]